MAGLYPQRNGQLSDAEILRDRYMAADEAMRTAPQANNVQSWGAPAQFASLALGMLGPVGAAAGYVLGNTAMNYAQRKDDQAMRDYNIAQNRFGLAQDYLQSVTQMQQYGGSRLGRNLDEVQRRLAMQLGREPTQQEVFEEYKRLTFGMGASKLVADPSKGVMAQYDPGSGTYRPTMIPISPESVKIDDSSGVPMIETVGFGGNTNTVPLSNFPDLYQSWNRMQGRVTDIEAQRAGDIAAATSWGDFDASAKQDVVTTLPMLYDERVMIEDMISAIRGGDYSDTGYLQGVIESYTDQETGELAAMSTLNLINKLENITLTPVSDPDIRMLRETWADVRKDPTANVGALLGALGFLEARIARYEAQLRHLRSGRSLDSFPLDPNPKSARQYIKEAKRSWQNQQDGGDEDIPERPFGQ